MKFCGGEGNSDIGSQRGEESFYLQGLWSQEHGEICWFCSQFLLLDVGSSYSCGRCSAVERNEIISFLANRPTKGPLGAGMSWKDCKEESESCSVVSDSLRPHGLYSPWNSPGQNTGMGSLYPLQGIFPTQGSNPGLPHCRWILYQLSHKGSPRILEWVAYPFSRSSRPRKQAGVSCIAGSLFTSWAVREAL